MLQSIAIEMESHWLLYGKAEREWLWLVGKFRGADSELISEALREVAWCRETHVVGHLGDGLVGGE